MNELLLTLTGPVTVNPVTPLPEPTDFNLSGQASAMFPSADGKYIYILGGYGPGSTASKTLARYDIESATWVRLVDVPRTYNNGNFLYPIANQVGSEIIAWAGTETSRYNIANNTWVSTRGSPSGGNWDLTQGRGCVRNNQLLSFGYGSTYSTGTKIVKYDPPTSVYSTVSTYQPVSKLWAYPATVLIGDRLYVGGDGNKLSWYDFISNTWGEKTIPFGNYNNFNFVNLKGKLYMMGAGPANFDVWSYNPTTEEFKVEPKTQWAVSSLNTATAGPDVIYCLTNQMRDNKNVARFFSYNPLS